MWLKRISAPSWWPIKRKTHKFITTVRGPHADALSLHVLVRDVLGLAETGKEAKTIITSGNVLVDGKKRKDIKFGVGSMDVIEIPLMKKSWRAVPRKGLTFIEADDNKIKLCRINGKRNIKKGKTQYNLHDGKNILSDKKYNTKDSLLLEIPSLKITDHVEFKEGNLAFVTRGSHDGLMSKIKTIDKINKRVWLNGEIEVPIKNIMMVGKDKPLVKVE
ncbi:MAG: 30S ribosomal protein S4e [Nanoarchaeota archaeon]|nr:30S ribosomal protein S4e [Nanoarchaeota archaeon]